jgi:hypothetical protein
MSDNINVHERLEALVARRELRNPGLSGTQIKKPAARNWRKLINNTTKYDAVKTVVGRRG